MLGNDKADTGRLFHGGFCALRTGGIWMLAAAGLAAVAPLAGCSGGPRCADACFDLGLRILEEAETGSSPEERHALAELGEAWTGLGTGMEEKSLLVEAGQVCLEALRHDPASREAADALLRAREHQGRLDEAIRPLRAALPLGIRPGETQAAFSAAARRLAEVLEACRDQVSLASAYECLGDSLLKSADPIAAEHAFGEAVRLQPEHAGAWRGLGNALSDRNQWDGAGVAYREAIRIHPSFAVAHFGLAMSMEEAARSGGEAGNPRSPLAVAHLRLGAALEEKGMVEEVIQICREWIRLQPAASAARDRLEHALRTRRQLEEAIEACLEACGYSFGNEEVEEDAPAARDGGKADLLARVGRIDGALEEAREKCGLAATYADFGEVLAGAGMSEAARKAREMADWLHPGMEREGGAIE